MKTRRILVFFILFFIILYIGFSFANVEIIAFADSEKNSEEELNESILNQIDQLDLEALQEYLDSLGNFTNTSAKEYILALIQGGKLEYDGIFKQVSSVFFQKIKEILPAFACITAITLLSGLISMMKSSSNVKTSAETIFLITYAAALIPLLAVLTECFQVSMKSMESMQTQMQIVFPIMLTLMAASGGTLSASVCRPAVAFFSTNVVSLMTSVVLPITITIIAFSLAGNLTKELQINRFTAFFKSINKWIIGVFVSVFGLFFTLQGITSAHYDGIVRRAAKYAIGNGVPIVGGFLSGGFDLAVAGVSLIKNSLGTMGVFMMLSVLFEPIVLLVSVALLLRLTSAITEPFGEGRISSFLGETAGNMQYCTASLLITAFLYFLSVMLMIYTSEALF